jgi:hypothetical protein
MKSSTIIIAAALLLGATSASFAQASTSFAAGAGADQNSGTYPSYGDASRGSGYYNYAPGYVANHPVVRRNSRLDTGTQR